MLTYYSSYNLSPYKVVIRLVFFSMAIGIWVFCFNKLLVKKKEKSMISSCSINSEQTEVEIKEQEGKNDEAN